LIVQLGTITEDLNRRWYERQIGLIVRHVERRMHHPRQQMDGSDPGWPDRTVRRGVRSQIHVAPVVFEEAAAERHMAQLQHNMWVAGARAAALSIITGGGKWLELSIHADPLYQHLMISAGRTGAAS
jgi:hypothetical protein